MPKYTPAANNFGRTIAWIALAFGGILLLVVAIYFIRRAKANKKADAEINALLQGSNSNSATTNTGIPVLPGTGVNTDGTPNTPTPTNNGGSNTTSPATQLPEWLVTLLWKANEASSSTNYSTHEKNQYACEVSNNVMGITLDQVRTLKSTYKLWYNRNLIDDVKQWKCGGGTLDFGCPNDCTKVTNRLNSAG